MKLQVGNKVQEFVDAITGELVSGTITRLTPDHVHIINDDDPTIAWAYPRSEFEKGTDAYWRKKERTPMNMITKLFQDFQALPDDFTVEGKFGTGPFARQICPDRPHMQKIILSGDTKTIMALNLYYLLHDLAIDCGWTLPQVYLLRAEIFSL